MMHRLFGTSFLVLSLTVSLSSAGFWQHLNFVEKNDASESSRNVRTYDEKWFTQQLDHFDRANTGQWQQRYRVDSQFYTRDGPVLILISGESATLSSYLLEKGLMFEIAQELHGVMFHLEHRFYGVSKPTADTSVDNLKFLSSEQGLADLAMFTSWVRTQYPGAKVFVFGGSYAGDLSAWFQLQYRHLVDGVFSASAPYLAEVDFGDYAKTIERVANAEAPGCYDRFVEGINAIVAKFPNEPTTKALKAKFRLCDDMTTDSADLYTLIDNMISPIARAIQYGDQDRTQPFNNAWEYCSNLTSVADPLEGLAKVNAMYLDGYDEQCVLTYGGFLEALKNTSWESSFLASRGWIWQTCTEFGWYQTYTDGKPKPNTFLPLSYFLQICNDVYGPEYGKLSYVQQNVDRTNAYYGGYGLASDKTVIWNGDYDPWSRVSIRWPIADASETHVFNVPKNSHCTVMRAPLMVDSAEAVDVRQQIKALFKRWMAPLPVVTCGGHSLLPATSKAIVGTLLALAFMLA